MKRWVLVDVSCLAYRALHSTGELDFEASPTGVIFGLFHQLRQICQDSTVNSNRVCLFFDSRKSYRSKLFSDYKKKRRDDRTPEQKAAIAVLWKQVNVMEREVFPAIGIPCYRQVGLESDDLIAQAAHQIRQQGERAVIITSDGDLFQLISDNVHWYDPGRRIYFTPGTFETTKGIEAREWGRVKTLAGCKSDNVPGIPGIGEKTAIKFLNGQLPSRLKTFEKIISVEGHRIQNRNTKLVILPHRRTRPIKLRDPHYNIEAFFDVCRKYGLKSFLAKRSGWANFFRGGITGLLQGGNR